MTTEQTQKKKVKKPNCFLAEITMHVKFINSCGIKKYLKLQIIDWETGDIKEIESFISKKTIGTSGLVLSSENILKLPYLWKVTESFRLLKTDLMFH